MRPVAIVLRRAGRAAPEAAFVGPEGLPGSIGRILGLSGLVCELTVLPLLPPEGDRADLARRAAAAITAVTGVRHPVRSGTVRARRPVLPTAAEEIGGVGSGLGSCRPVRRVRVAGAPITRRPAARPRIFSAHTADGWRPGTALCAGQLGCVRAVSGGSTCVLVHAGLVEHMFEPRSCARVTAAGALELVFDESGRPSGRVETSSSTTPPCRRPGGERMFERGRAPASRRPGRWNSFDEANQPADRVERRFEPNCGASAATSAR